MNYISTPLDEWIVGTEWLPAIGQPLSRSLCQELAIRIAYQGLGHVSPNPLVGSVIVDREQKFLGAGAHLKCGSHHAEIQVIADVKKRHKDWQALFKGSTIYVTLEPCSHTNKTPPCVNGIIEAGIGHVVFGTLDPNPLVSGRGRAALMAAGVQVEVDEEWGTACRNLAEVFLHGVLHKRPFVGLKVAQTIDGTMARLGDQRVFITSKRARQYGHFLRHYYDAIAVGRKTLILDNPTLDARHDQLGHAAPWRIVLDPNCEGLVSKSLSEIKLLKNQPEKVIWVVSETHSKKDSVAALEELGVKVLPVSMDDGRFNFDNLTRTLFAMGIHSILLEGGAGLYARWLASGQVNRVHAFVAPKIFGGQNRVNFTGELTEVSDMELKNVKWTPLGSDLLIEGDLNEWQ